MGSSEIVKRQAFEVGFDLCGIASAETIPDASAKFQSWLGSGYHGEMSYMANEPERRMDPKRILPDAHSVIVLGLNYFQENSGKVEAGYGRVSRYARGRDYHKVITKKTKQLLAKLKGAGSEFETASFKWFVDYGPVLERSYAVQAGLGFLGKNGMLINRKFGSWIFLSEIITDLELEHDDARIINHGRCGTCRRCLDACPTHAIVEEGTVDARRCISYLTIERPGIISPLLAERKGDLFFGCDICQEVCPHNGRAIVTKHDELLASSGVGEFIDCGFVLSLTSREEFLELTAGTPLTRAKLEGLRRNAGIVLENQRRMKGK